MLADVGDYPKGTVLWVDEVSAAVLIERGDAEPAGKPRRGR